MTELLLDLAKRFPVVSGMLGMSLGLSALYFSVEIGNEYAEFVGGASATGQVEKIAEDAPREPSVDATWSTGGKTHRARVRVYRYELPDPRALDPERRLEPGRDVALILSTRNPDPRSARDTSVSTRW